MCTQSHDHNISIFAISFITNIVAMLKLDIIHLSNLCKNNYITVKMF